MAWTSATERSSHCCSNVVSTYWWKCSPLTEAYKGVLHAQLLKNHHVKFWPYMVPISDAALVQRPAFHSVACLLGQRHANVPPDAFPNISWSSQCSRGCTLRTYTYKWRPTQEIWELCPWMQNMMIVVWSSWKLFLVWRRGDTLKNCE